MHYFSMSLTTSAGPADVNLFKLSTRDLPDEEAQKVKREQVSPIISKKENAGGEMKRFYALVELAISVHNDELRRVCVCGKIQ